MARAARKYKPNSFYHVYNRGNNKEHVLKFSADKQVFIGLLYKHKELCNIRLVTYCIMDNHFHLVVQTGRDPRLLSKFMHRVGTSYAVYLNRKRDRIGYVFQGRYHANYLMYKKDLVRAMNYVKQNPVVDGIVKKPKDYRWTKV